MFKTVRRSPTNGIDCRSDRRRTRRVKPTDQRQIARHGGPSYTAVAVGRAKDLMMQEEEQGWSFSDHQICSRCISDPYLKQRIKAAATDEEPCSFCRRRPSVELDDVMEIIGNTVADYYNRAVNEAWYDGREGGYQGPTFDNWEVMDDIVGGVSTRDDVLEAIHRSFDDDIWVERNMYSLNGARKYVASWEQFCDAVKHEAKHGSPPEEDGLDHHTIPVSAMLEELEEIASESGMIRTLPADLVIHRVRAHQRDEVCDSRETLGPPPSDKAPTNRMSAAGVSVFYGAYARTTAAIEASVSMPAGREWTLTAGAWLCSRPLRVLDLSDLPEVPSIFAASREWRGALLFLRDFVASISAPVVHDNGEHIEYVPTQLLTDHFRKHVTAPDGSPLDGIVYPSARRRRGTSLVVFRSRDELDPSKLGGQEALLKLDPGSVTRLPRVRRRTR
jgi:hypothetical protein